MNIHAGAAPAGPVAEPEEVRAEAAAAGTVLVRDGAFGADDTAGLSRYFAADAEMADAPFALVLDPGLAPSVPLPAALARAALVIVPFAGFADGRGFSLARRLRAEGFRGRLRAAGPLLPDQYPMALRAGFDEVEIPADLACRLGEPHWRAAAARAARPDHRARLCRSA